MKRRLKVAVIGCGNRARIYLELMAEQKEQFEIVAAADPNSERVSFVKQLSGNEHFLSFENGETLLDRDRLADIILITTLDNLHYGPCKKALEKGYDVLLEKPMAETLPQIIDLERVAVKLNRRVIVCHVLRYTSFYRKLKEILDSGLLGEIITLNANEGIGTWHMVHSYVRGNWSRMDKTTPTIVAKCCHDMDIIHWLLGKRCLKISSFGGLNFFNQAHKPEGAPLRCTNGCPVENTCLYNAKKYLTNYRFSWLPQVFDKINDDAAILKWLEESPWGKCVYQCDNNALDHQVVNMEFESNITATFTMTAFENERHYEISGTKAALRAGSFYKRHTGADIIITEHETNNVTFLSVEDKNPHPKFGGYHYGGDVGLIKELFSLFTESNDPLSSITASVHSHEMAFIAEKARITGVVQNLSEIDLGQEKTSMGQCI